MAATDEQATAPAGRRALLWGVRIWLGVAIFFATLTVLAAFFDRFPSDERIADAIQRIDAPAFGGYMEVINRLGDAWVYFGLTLGFGVAFAVVRAGTEAVVMLATVGPRVLNSLLKDLIERPRPSADLVEISEGASGFSYPSGHTVGTAALFGALFFLLPVLVRHRLLRWTLQAGCLLAIVSAGPARVYVGVHWPSDVLGAYLLTVLLLSPPIAAYVALSRSQRPRTPG